MDNNTHDSILKSSETVKDINPQGVIDTNIENPSYKFVEVDFHQENNSFSIQLLSIEQLSLFDFVEIDISFDPLGDDVLSKHYSFLPFEDYINDTKNNNSMYRSKEDIAKVLSGFSTAAIMSGIAVKFDPSDIPRLESQLALITGLVSGTLIWPWVEARIMNMTAGHKLQFKERYYNYERKKSTTGTRYSDYGRRQRNKILNKKGMSNLKPDQMGVVIDSKSQKIRFRFNKKQFIECKGYDKINILKVKLCKEHIKDFYEKGVVIGVHIKFGEKPTYLPFIDKRIELIQTLLLTDGKVRIGCVPENKSKGMRDPDEDVLQDGYMEVRDTISFQRAKYYVSLDTEHNTIIEYAQTKDNKIGI